MRAHLVAWIDSFASKILGIGASDVLDEVRRCLSTVWAQVGLRRFAAGLLLVFAVLVGLHLILALGSRMEAEPFESLWQNGKWRLDRDHSVSEHVEYLLLLFAAVAAASCWRKTTAPVYFMLAVVNLLFLVGGYFRAHETLGSNAEVAWQGELVYFSVVGAVLFLLVVGAFWRSPVTERLGGAVGFSALSAAAACGVVIDALHSIVKFNTERYYLREALAVVEDGGELFFIMMNTLLMAAVYWRILREGSRRYSQA